MTNKMDRGNEKTAVVRAAVLRIMSMTSTVTINQWALNR